MPDETTTSPFAAPATTAPDTAAPQGAPEGDTSFLDSLSAREPLIKPCMVPGVIVAMAAKDSANGTPFLNIAVTLFGDNMVYEDGSPVQTGKRLTTTVFASGKDQAGIERTARQLKNLHLALLDIPLDGKEDERYKALPAGEKIALGRAGVFLLHALEPLDKWNGTKVMVQVRFGKNTDNTPRNEFTLFAASTKPVERKK